MEIEKLDKIKESALINEIAQIIIKEKKAEQKAIKLQNQNYLLTTALVVESIILGLMIIF
jgi:hypothetical protein